jgi:steroid delta-isomerase
MSAPLNRVVEFFEHITPADAARMGELYTDDARFKDPFNEVIGSAAIARIFEHMFEQVDAPRFIVSEAIAQGDRAFLIWSFEFSFRPPLGAGRQSIRGASHLHFAADGRICLHRDYWDAAEELYQKLPVLGALMRWMRRRAAVPGP